MKHQGEALQEKTSVKQMLHAVLRGDRAFKVLVETTSDMVHLNNEQGTILYANPITHELLGYSVQEFVGSQSIEYIHPEDRETVALDMKEVVSGTTVSEREIRLLKKDGCYLDVSVKGFVLNVEDGGALIGAIFRDISGQKKIERDHVEYQYTLEKLVEQRTRHLQELLTFSQSMIRTGDLNSLYRRITSTSKELLNLDFSTLMIVSGDRKSLVIQDSIGFADSMVGSFALLQGQGLSTFVVQAKSHAVVLDFASEKRFEIPPVVLTEKITSALCVPMMIGEDVFGVLIGHTHSRRVFPQEEISLFQSFANQAAVAISHAVRLKSLYVSEQKLRTILDTIPSPIFCKNVDGVYLDFNVAFENFLGLSREEILNSTAFDIAPKELAEVYHQADLELIERGGGQVYEAKVRYGDGSNHDVLFHKATYTDEKDEVQGLVGAMIDITKRKQAEIDLAAEKELLSVTLRSIGDGVITTDTKGNIVLLNKVAEALCGWSQEEAQGRPLTDVFNIINEKTRERCENPAQKVLETGAIIGLANHTALIQKGGKEISIADSGSPIRDKRSVIIGVVLVFRDVTEKKRIEEELLKVKKIESVGVLAGGLAHDFNNILAAIVGNIDLALSYTDSSDKRHNLLVGAQKASLRAKDLTRQLLTFSKGGEPIKKSTSVAEVVKDSTGFVLRGSNIRCDYHCNEELWAVDIDPGQIGQVFQNLVLNANQAMKEGGVVDISFENVEVHEGDDGQSPVPGKYVKICVRDRGSGIPEKVIDKIFDPYFTTKQRGSGLGLAITHSIIRKHKGTIGVQSELGTGTTFTIYLPASSKQLQAIQGSDHIEKCRGAAIILIMDDDEMVRSISQQMLSHLGYRTILAKDGVEARDLYRKLNDAGKVIDLVLMDLTIPGGMGGEEAVQEILKINPEAKVVVSSGYSNNPIMANYANYGFCGSIVKPFKLKELAKIVAQVLS